MDTPEFFLDLASEGLQGVFVDVESSAGNLLGVAVGRLHQQDAAGCVVEDRPGAGHVLGQGGVVLGRGQRGRSHGRGR